MLLIFADLPNLYKFLWSSTTKFANQPKLYTLFAWIFLNPKLYKAKEVEATTCKVLKS